MSNLLGRYEREVTASLLFAMTEDYGYQWPITGHQFNDFLQKAYADREQMETRHRSLRNKYLRRYMRQWRNGRKRYIWLSILSLGLANAAGVNPKPPAVWSDYGFLLTWLDRRIEEFLHELSPPQYRVFLDNGVGQGYGVGLAEIRDRGGLKIEGEGLQFTLHPLPPLEALFDRWRASADETVH